MYTRNEIVLLVGIPGSGKSTLAKTVFSCYTRINLDMLHTRHRENLEIRRALRNGESIVVDNTNITKKVRQKYVDTADKFDIPIRAIYLKCTLEVALIQNAMRPSREFVPENAVRMYHRLLEVPTTEEGFQKVELVERQSIFSTNH